MTLSWSLVVARQFESGDDVHGLHLLEQQLAGVWDTQGGNVAGRLTVVTPEKLNKNKNLQWNWRQTRGLITVLLALSSKFLVGIIRSAKTCFTYCMLDYLRISNRAQYVAHHFDHNPNLRTITANHLNYFVYSSSEHLRSLKILMQNSYY